MKKAHINVTFIKMWSLPGEEEEQDLSDPREFLEVVKGVREAF